MLISIFWVVPNFSLTQHQGRFVTEKGHIARSQTGLSGIAAPRSGPIFLVGDSHAGRGAHQKGVSLAPRSPLASALSVKC